MAEARGRKGMPRPDYDGVEYFEPLPGEGSGPPEWRDVHHGLNSMDLLVEHKLGGANERGEVEWVPDQLQLRLSDPNTVRIRWNIGEDQMPRYGLSDPRVRLTIWRW